MQTLLPQPTEIAALADVVADWRWVSCVDDPRADFREALPRGVPHGGMRARHVGAQDGFPDVLRVCWAPRAGAPALPWASAAERDGLAAPDEQVPSRVSGRYVWPPGGLAVVALPVFPAAPMGDGPVGRARDDSEHRACSGGQAVRVAHARAVHDSVRQVVRAALELYDRGPDSDARLEC
jgi:hypothetical protein